MRFRKLPGDMMKHLLKMDFCGKQHNIYSNVNARTFDNDSECLPLPVQCGFSQPFYSRKSRHPLELSCQNKYLESGLTHAGITSDRCA